MGALLFLLAAAARASVPPPDPDRSLGQVIAFDGFVDEGGRSFRAARDDGRAWIVSPIYTRCPTTCAALTASLQAALRASGLRPADYRALSFSFDPQETDASLAEFRERMRLPAEWVTLRAADPAALERTLRGLDFRTLQLDGGGFEHPNVVAVLDGDLRVVDYVYGLPPSPDALARTIRRARTGASPLDRWRPYALLLTGAGFALSAAVFLAVLGRRRSSFPPTGNRRRRGPAS
jgi:cytochrome oxidase Cu insertion factor (SCO1/SenC/PrrC family)